MAQNPQRPGSRRDSLFAFADARGNNPHMTRERGVDEDRRLNAQRYETVNQMDRALDARARRNSGARMPGLMRPIGDVPAGGQLPNQPAPHSSGPTFMETLFIFAAGAGLMWLFTRPDKKDDVEEGELLRNSFEPTPPTPVTVVLSNPPANPQNQQSIVPVVVVPPPLEAKTSRRRRSKKPSVTVTVEPPVVVSPSTTVPSTSGTTE